ncbi:hypothetical protein NEMIN01_1789 [Nematocida minor]|uniref:uncharacterized protein n=1 Tax=Nematocida minor TaxID=1912983 RepID=UPI00221EFB4C|nr:uncharacterized protein NEMIN01_1789 [Nematocida minor]KAI5192041.1 hypothetical protein NEMIN01_1789 [Nematocida minor]
MNIKVWGTMKIIKLMLALSMCAGAYYITYLPTRLARYLKENKRNKELKDYRKAEEFYSSLKITSNPFKNSRLVNSPGFARLVGGVKERIESGDIQGVPDADLDTMDSIIGKYEAQVLANKKDCGIADLFPSLKEAYLKEFMHCVQMHIRDKYMSAARKMKMESVQIKNVMRTLKKQKISKEKIERYVENLKEIEQHLKMLNISNIKKEKYIQHKIERIGEIEGNVSYLEIFQTLPAIKAKESKEFKTRLFRLHTIQYLEEFGSYWSILFTNTVASTLVELLI